MDSKEALYGYAYNTVVGKLHFVADDEHILYIAATAPSMEYVVKETTLIREAAQQTKEYLQGARVVFDFPFKSQGTAFQEAVWAALRAIPYGETRSYGEIAQAIGNPKAARAVGMANHQNPLLLVNPCHRVIAADGSLGGFACGIAMKEFLLALEKAKR